MNYNQTKVDEMTLALMFLTTTEDQFGARSWKGYDWDVLGRLHAAGYISNPVGKAKSVAMTEKGKQLSEELFQKHFSKAGV
jgi:hypothetical protein